MNHTLTISDNIVFKGQSKKGNALTIRYPTASDVHVLWRYINTISQERTYVRFQGEKISLEKEKEYLDTQLKKIAERKSLVLLIFTDSELIGLGSVELKKRTKKHIGELSMSVAQDYRGEGIGSLLLNHILLECVNHLPALEILTFSVFSNNVIGQSIYQKFGFIEYGYLPNGVKLENDYVDRILMYKKIERL